MLLPQVSASIGHQHGDHLQGNSFVINAVQNVPLSLRTNQVMKAEKLKNSSTCKFQHYTESI
jgi:hypothetical protein